MIKDKVLRITYGSSAALILVDLIVSVLGLPLDRGAIIIRFDNYHNEVVWSGSVGVFFGAIGTMVIITILNAWLSVHIYEKEKFLSYIIASGTIIAVFAISLIN